MLHEALFVAFAVVARASESRPGEFNAQSLANTAWAYATAGQLDEALVGEGGTGASWRVQCVKPRQHCWAFATAGQLNEALFTAFARAAEPRLGELNA